MKTLRLLITLCVIFFSTLSIAQKTTGVLYYDTKTQLNAYTPSVRFGGELVLVQEDSTLYTYSRSLGIWKKAIEVDTIAEIATKYDLTQIKGDTTITRTFFDIDSTYAYIVNDYYEDGIIGLVDTIWRYCNDCIDESYVASQIIVEPEIAIGGIPVNDVQDALEKLNNNTPDSTMWNQAIQQNEITNGVESYRTDFWGGYAIIKIDGSGSFYILDDADHTPYGVDSIQALSTTFTEGFTLFHSNPLGSGSRRVGFAQISVDDELALAGAQVGASVTLNSIKANISLPAPHGYIKWSTGTTFIDDSYYSGAGAINVLTSITWNAGNSRVVVTHPNIFNGRFDMSVTPADAELYYCKVAFVDRQKFEISFYDRVTNSLITDPTGLEFYFNRHGRIKFDAATMENDFISAAIFVNWVYAYD